MDKSKSVLIEINSFDELKDFSNVIVSFNSDINIYRGSDFYDAKSLMTIVVMDMSVPRNVEIISNDNDEVSRFIKEMNRFKYNKTN